MINAKQFRNIIVRSSLEMLGHWSQEAENLLVMIMSWESKGGTYLEQVNGPAQGIYMMEPATHDDIYENFISKNEKLSNRLDALFDCNEVSHWHANMMAINMIYATAMARIFFLRVKEPIPLGLHELAAYAKKYWNTEKGKATPDDYYQAYCRFEGIAP
jgi:hypothetical protein